MKIQKQQKENKAPASFHTDNMAELEQKYMAMVEEEKAKLEDKLPPPA
jgi:hypothetical protein